MDKVIECLASGKDDPTVRLSREEIGSYLEYPNPRASIAGIHLRYEQELVDYCETAYIRDGLRLRDAKFYTPRGVFEICRHSTKPKADEFFKKFLNALEGKQ